MKTHTKFFLCFGLAIVVMLVACGKREEPVTRSGEAIHYSIERPVTTEGNPDPRKVAEPYCQGSAVREASLHFFYSEDAHTPNGASLSFRCNNGFEGRMKLQ